MGDWWRAHPASAALAVVVVCAGGVIAALRLPVLADPESAAPWIDLRLAVPGSSANSVDEEVAGRVEDVVRSTRGVRAVVTTSRRDGLTMVVRCDPSIDHASVRGLIADGVRKYCEREGPGVTVEEVVVGGYNGERTQGDQIAIAVWRPGMRESPGELVREVMVPALLALQGVATVRVAGDRRRSIRLTVREDAIARYGTTASGIAALLSKQISRQNLSHVPAFPFHGVPVVEIADLAILHERPIVSGPSWRIDGHPAVLLTVKRAPQADARQLCGRVQAAIAACKGQLPPGTRWMVLEDPAMQFRVGFMQTLWLALASLGLGAVVSGWWCRNWRASASFAAMVVCLLSGTAISLNVTGRTLDPATVAGAVLGLVCTIPWITAELSGATRPPFPGHVLGAVAGSTLVALSRFPVDPEGAVLLGSAGFGMAAVCFSTLLAGPAIAIAGPRLDGHHCPVWLIRISKAASVWARRRRRPVLAFTLLFLGVPLWLVPHEVPRHHPLFRLHLITFGSRLYKDIRPTIEQLSGGIVRLAIARGTWGDPPPEEGRTAVVATLDLAAGSAEKTLAAVAPFENCALAIVGDRARVIVMQTEGTAMVRVEFDGALSEGPLPHRIMDAFRQLGASLGNVRVAVLGVGPGFQSGQLPAATVDVELRGYDWREMERIARQLCMFLEAHPRVHDIDLHDSGGERKLRLTIDPGVIGGRTMAAIRAKLREHAGTVSLVELSGSPVPVRIGGTMGDSTGPASRISTRPGPSRALKDLVRVRTAESAAAIVREQREYVLRVGCTFDGPPEHAREVIAGFSREYPLPPGNRIAIRNESEAPGTLSAGLTAGGLALAACASMLTLVVVRNTWGVAGTMFASFLCGIAGMACAVILMPIPAGAWSACALGGVLIVSGAAGASLASPEGGGVEGLTAFACVLSGVAAPFIAGSCVPGIRPVFHAESFALWAGIATPISLVLCAVFVPALEREEAGA